MIFEDMAILPKGTLTSARSLWENRAWRLTFVIERSFRHHSPTEKPDHWEQYDYLTLTYQAQRIDWCTTLHCTIHKVGWCLEYHFRQKISRRRLNLVCSRRLPLFLFFFFSLSLPVSLHPHSLDSMSSSSSPNSIFRQQQSLYRLSHYMAKAKQPTFYTPPPNALSAKGNFAWDHAPVWFFFLTTH